MVSLCCHWSDTIDLDKEMNSFVTTSIYHMFVSFYRYMMIFFKIKKWVSIYIIISMSAFTWTFKNGADHGVSFIFDDILTIKRLLNLTIYIFEKLSGPAKMKKIMSIQSVKIKSYFCLYRLQAVNPCESKLQSSPQDQTDGATLLPLLEHALEGAHTTLLDMHWRVHLYFEYKEV